MPIGVPESSTWPARSRLVGQSRGFRQGRCGSALVVSPAFVQPDPFAQIGKRFLFPWADIARVSRFAVELAPGDTTVTTGSDLAATATVRSRFGESVSRSPAWLEWTGASGKPHRIAMAAGPDAKRGEQTFTVTLPRLTGSLTYRAIVGGEASRRHHINVIDRPSVTVLKASVAPPAYTGRPPAPARDPDRIDAWEDSLVTLDLEANRPLKEAELTWPAPAADAKSPSPAGPPSLVSMKGNAEGTRWSASVVASASGPYSITLRDQYDLESKPEAPRRVRVHADLPPSVVLRGSR